MIYLGIDPGLKGAATIVTDSGNVVVQEWTTVLDVYDWLATFTDDHTLAVIEKIGWGAKVSKNAGEWIGMLTALRIPFKEITPKKWQKHFGTFSKEKTRRKNELKQIAQQLHPQIKWTHATAAAFLIATYCREVAWK